MAIIINQLINTVSYKNMPHEHVFITFKKHLQFQYGKHRL